MGHDVSLVDGHIDEPKMTDEEIMKALECCMNEDGNTTCRDCPLCNCSMDCFSINSKNAVDLIKRKDAEIERLEKILENRGAICKLCEGKYTEKIKRAKAKAIKEFAERFEDELGEDFFNHYPFVLTALDNLVKEMVGD